MIPQTQQVLKLAKKQGIISRQDVRTNGLREEYLARLANIGELEVLAPGVYMHAQADLGEHLELAVVAKRVPRAIFFGVTALTIHQLTTQVAHTVDFAVERGTRTPKLAWPATKVAHLSGISYTMGVETHKIAYELPIRVYSVAKTVADLFKFRHQIGLDIAIEALKEGWQANHFTMEELTQCAKACRVDRVMQPYMEMLS